MYRGGPAQLLNNELFLFKIISSSKILKCPLFLPVSIFAYNISTHLSTGYSPFEMLYGRKPALPPVLYLLVSDQKAVSPGLYLSRLTSALIKLHTNAYVSAESRQINSHTASNSRIEPYYVFSVGDQVLYLSQPSGSRLSKLDSIWRGPFTVTNKVGVDVYMIKCNSMGAVVNRVHSKFLKLYC